MEGLFHLYANRCQLRNSIYLLNHYTAGVILFGERNIMRRHSLPRVMLVFSTLICSDLKKKSNFYEKRLICICKVWCMTAWGFGLTNLYKSHSFSLIFSKDFLKIFKSLWWKRKHNKIQQNFFFFHYRLTSACTKLSSPLWMLAGCTGNYWSVILCCRSEILLCYCMWCCFK